MSALSEHVSLTITQDSVGIARASFGIALILSHNASFPERARVYGSFADVIADFPTTTSPEYLAAQALFAQSPHPDQVIIGRASLKPTQQYKVGAAQVVNSWDYKLNVAGQGVTPTSIVSTSDGTATQPEIHNALLTALNAVVGKNYAAAFAPLAFNDFNYTADSTTDQLHSVAHGLNTGDGPVRTTNTGGALPTGLAAATDYYVIKVDADNFKLATSLANALAGTAIDITANGTGTQTLNHQAGTLSPNLPLLVTGSAPGNWFSLEVVDPAYLTCEQTHVDPGVATDLAAIQIENDDWYAIYTLYNSAAYVEAVAAYIETQKKIYIVDVPDTKAETLAVGGGGTDVADVLHTDAYTRTALAYHPRPASMIAAAWLGRMLPIDPGSDNWKFKTLAGVAPVKSTATYRTNLRNKKANSYQTIAGRNITWEGTCASGEFIDVTRGLDWIDDDMTKAVFGVLVEASKVPMSDEGIALVENEIRGSLGRAVAMGILLAGSIDIKVEALKDVPDNDQSLRILPNITWTAKFAQSINKVTINGTVSV